MKNILVLSLFAIAAAVAQPPSGAPSVTELKAYLNLSDTQIASITAANRSAFDANRALGDQLRTKQQALQTTLANGSTDATAIGKAVLELQALRKQMETAQAKVREQAVSFLAADQKSKLKTLEDAEKLRPVIGEAHQLQLLAPPANAAGPGPIGPNGPGPRRFGKFQQ